MSAGMGSAGYSARQISARGLEFVAREEGCILRPYNDSRGFATVGIGHLIAMRPVSGQDRIRYAHFTKADAIALLRRDMAVAVNGVNAAVHVSLNQNEADALYSLAFNIGVGAFRGSTLLRRLNAGDRRGAANAFLMWHVGGPGLIYRRQRERALFLTATVDPLAVLMPFERTWVQEYDRLKAGDRNLVRRSHLRAVMTRQRKRIWLVSQPKARGGDGSGWRHAHRLERYRLLRARTV